MLKKFWEWIRRLFAAPPEKTDQELSTEKRRAWFEQCEPGFVVWARMPLPEEELAKVEPAHQIRPYPVSYTHLDVYKRQGHCGRMKRASGCGGRIPD